MVLSCSKKSLKDVLKYLEQLPCRSVQPIKSGAQILEEATVQIIEKTVDSLKVGEVRMQPFLGDEHHQMVHSEALFRDYYTPFICPCKFGLFCC